MNIALTGITGMVGSHFIKKILEDNSVHYDEIGIVTENEIIVDKEPILHIDELIESNKNWLEEYMDK